MRFLAKLEKEKIIWWIIILCTAFFFLRLPSVIEPYWYGDEGVYEVIGQAMDHGRVLYRDIWDNKPPLLYTVYALAQGNQQDVKIISLLVGIISIVAYFLLSQKLYSKYLISIITSSIYIILLGTPILEGDIANAEVFILPFTIIAGLLIYRLAEEKQKRPSTSTFKLLASIAGLLLGIAFLFKIVAIFDVAAFLLFLCISYLPEKLSWNSLQKQFSKETRYKLFIELRSIILGFFIPFIIAVFYFTMNHAVANFFQAVFSGNIAYVVWENNLLGSPIGFLLIKIVLLGIGIALIIWKRNYFTKPALFTILWLLFSFFNTFFSERPYTHYVIVLIPSFCLLLGLLLASKQMKTRISIAIGIVILLFMLNLQFKFNFQRVYSYYQNTLQFVQNKESVTAYQSFFDQKTPRDYALAAFIRKNTTPSDTIFIWGNSPQVYALSHKLPPGKYTVAYHIIENNAVDQTQQAIAKAQPKYIIALEETRPLPFNIPLYIMRYKIDGALIYERTR